MSGDSLETIIEQTYLRAAISSDDPKFTTSKMTSIVNMALRQCSTDQDPFWLRTSASMAITSGTYSYPTSAYSRFVKVARIEDDEMFDLISVNPNEISRYYRVNGTPSVYTVEGSFIKIGPNPTASATFTLHYYQWEEALTAMDKRPLLPVQYTDYLVARAGYICAMQNQDPMMVGVLKQEIEEWRGRLRDDLRQMRANPRIRIREDWGSR
jgi:hypothetical protein